MDLTEYVVSRRTSILMRFLFGVPCMAGTIPGAIILYGMDYDDLNNNNNNNNYK
jgi:hypothetical protein